MADDEIALNQWAADDLKAQPGASIRLTYFEPETTHGQPREHSATFRLRTVLPLTAPVAPYRRNRPARFAAPPTWANDPDLTPEVAGVTDQESIDDWDPPFPFDYAADPPSRSTRITGTATAPHPRPSSPRRQASDGGAVASARRLPYGWRSIRQ